VSGIDHVGYGQVPTQPGKTSGVRHDVANPDGAFPVLGELRPVRGDGSVRLEEPALDEQERAGGDETFSSREDGADGVVLPSAGRGGIGDSPPEVYKDLSVLDRTEGGANISPLAEIALKLVLDANEPGCDEACHL